MIDPEIANAFVEVDEDGDDDDEEDEDDDEDVDDEDPFGSTEVELEGTIRPEVNGLLTAAADANKNGGRHRLSE